MTVSTSFAAASRLEIQSVTLTCRGTRFKCLRQTQTLKFRALLCHLRRVIQPRRTRVQQGRAACQALAVHGPSIIIMQIHYDAHAGLISAMITDTGRMAADGDITKTATAARATLTRERHACFVLGCAYADRWRLVIHVTAAVGGQWAGSAQRSPVAGRGCATARSEVDLILIYK